MSDKNFIVYGDLNAIHPGLGVEGTIEELEITPEEFVKRSNIDIKTLRRLLDGEIPVTWELGEKLKLLTGTGPDMWLKLQHRFDTKLAEIEKARAREREHSKKSKSHVQFAAAL